MNQIATIEAPILPSFLIDEDMEAAAEFLIAEKAGSTQRAYRSDFGIFRAYCTARGLAAMPAAVETVMGFLSAEAKGGARASTLGRRVAAIRYAHKLADHEPPTNNEAVKALRHLRQSPRGSVFEIRRRRSWRVAGARFAGPPRTPGEPVAGRGGGINGTAPVDQRTRHSLLPGVPNLPGGARWRLVAAAQPDLSGRR
jgi:hypothetical protein